MPVWHVTPDPACPVLQSFWAKAVDAPATLSAPAPEAPTKQQTDGSGSKGRESDWLFNLVHCAPRTSQSSPVQPDTEEVTFREQYASPAVEGTCVTPLSAKV